MDVYHSVPLVAFLLDTTTQVLEHSQAQSDIIFSCPVIMIECSYLVPAPPLGQPSLHTLKGLETAANEG